MIFKTSVLFLTLTIVYKSLLHYIENMGSGSPCTCNARVCNYNKQKGYGFDTGEATIDAGTQKGALSSTLTDFMTAKSSPTAYFQTIIPEGSDKSPSQTALNTLRNNIAGVKPIKGLTLSSFCVDINDSYTENPKEPYTSSTKEGYVCIKPKTGASSVLICIIIAIALFSIAGFIIYRYVTCPCRKQHEKELQEAELRS